MTLVEHGHAGGGWCKCGRRHATCQGDRREPGATMTTYKRADGEMYGWVVDTEFFDDEEEPVELVEEVWVRQSKRTFWKVPAVLYDCGVPDCDEDAVEWEMVPDGAPVAVCENHRRRGGEGDHGE